MKSYLNLMEKILQTGEKRMDRTGTGILSLFGERLEFDLKEGFPLVTTKKVYFRGVLIELLWMLSGSTNIKYLQDNKVSIWDGFSDQEGNLGPTYGHQLRNFNSEGIDQVKNAIKLIKNDPTSRRILISLTNPAQEFLMALPPCISILQFYVSGKDLSCQIYQRSCDLFLGGPFDISQYATLLSMIAMVTDKTPSKLIFNYGDVHLYLNHLKQAETQIKRIPKELPQLSITQRKNIDDFKFEDFTLVGYDPYETIKAPISI